MLKRLFYLIVLAPNILLSQENPFQVLVCNKATAYGQEVKPLQLVDDVTSIEIGEGGFLALVHYGGTTYEIRNKVFTFYLKPEELKNRSKRPPLEFLYSDTAIYDHSKSITVLHPSFDLSGFLEWNNEAPLNVYWHLHDQPVLNYKLTVFDHEDKKIQDYRTSKNTLELKPKDYGLSEPLFSFKLSSTFAAETIESKTYTVSLKPSARYEKKASDNVLKALDLETNPVLALNVWKETLKMTNGKEYFLLYKKFLERNSQLLTDFGENVAQLISEGNN